ncbi:type I polyketide synthase, partial [Kitasatospora putterlickiae]|uniref:type I polyketide synthase n=1 Tax=Kitasatospora putterlickiae TaxID=221725 RepID=UPI0031D2C651
MADEEKLQKYLRRATAELQQLRGRLATEEARNREPIAIVGLGCRFPGGVRSPEDLWELMEAGADVVSPLPTDRGWQLAGAMPHLRGGFLTDADQFDPEFFGMDDAEARALDPQQRLLLLTCWEAFERAGIDPLSAKESRTAVYAGLQFGGYPLLLGGPPPEELKDYIGFGSSSGAAAGRVSYLMGLVGGALAVDTQCTSSLVAVHLAVKALRNGEAGLALAGGAHVMSLPGTLLEFQRKGTTGPSGRSQSFSSSSDGVSLAEGAGMLLLERLSDARRNGHPVLAVIRGSAINQDGTTNGMNAPRGQAQEQVIRQALADGRVGADSVDVVEGHGVGAVLGDGVEAQSVIATYGRAHSAENPVLLGSVKSNIGHTQSVGGVAGIVKIIMALRHQRLPRTIHVERPTPHADWSAGTVRLATEERPWPRGERVRRAGVTCLTLSGTNAHLVLEEPPLDEPAEAEETAPAARPIAWTLSARTAAALREQAARVRAACAGTDPRDTAVALATSRSAFRHRAVVLAPDRDGLLAGLDALAADTAAGALPAGVSVHRGTAAGSGRTALVFADSGLEHPGASEELAAAFAPFDAALTEVCAELDRALTETGEAADPRPLREQLADPERRFASPRLARAGHFALTVALHRTVADFGVEPEYLTGLGVGEVAAAHAAGALSLPDACALALALPVAETDAHGSLWLQAGEAELAADPDLAGPDGPDGPLTVTALDEPGGTVVSGAPERLAALAERWRARGRATGTPSSARTLPLVGAPSAEAAARLSRVVAALDVREPSVPLVSGLTGEVLTVERLRDEAYWADHARRPTRLLDAGRRLRAEGVTRFLELGPDAAMTALLRRGLAAFGTTPGRPLLLVGAQPEHPADTPDGGAVHALLAAVGTLHTAGVAVRWAPAFEGHRARPVELPTYPFQNRRCWLVPPDRPVAAPARPPTPLLGRPVELAEGSGQWFDQTFAGRS